VRYYKVLDLKSNNTHSVWSCKDHRHKMKCIYSNDRVIWPLGKEVRPYPKWGNSDSNRDVIEIPEEDAFLEAV